eukprot:scaffold92675_cov64-Attheya_sp.AAC.2
MAIVAAHRAKMCAIIVLVSQTFESWDGALRYSKTNRVASTVLYPHVCFVPVGHSPAFGSVNL